MTKNEGDGLQSDEQTVVNKTIDSRRREHSRLFTNDIEKCSTSKEIYKQKEMTIQTDVQKRPLHQLSIGIHNKFVRSTDPNNLFATFQMSVRKNHTKIR